MIVMLILGRADGSPTPIAGQYLAAYDPDVAHDTRIGVLYGEITATPDPRQAQAFLDIPAGMEEWRRTTSPPNHLRPDGQPNRPLTAFNVTFERMPGARA